ADDAFEAVVSLCVLEHVPAVESAVSEAARVLKAGGLFVFTVDSLSEPHTPPAYVAYHREKFYIADFLPAERIERLLDENGFDAIEWAGIGRNRISGAVLRLFALRYSVYRWFSPILAATALLADALGGSERRGYVLLVAARKKAP
ncbi:MAG: methyltransferase domain-containing protein, partial [Candidatus Hydrogenedentes bacterium]|nr:methyltransferase domain-containing protein [Candidatus Hydrogenedentota bacterium]